MKHIKVNILDKASMQNTSSEIKTIDTTPIEEAIKDKEESGNVKNIPKKIYLQLGDDIPDCDFNDLSEVCWHKEKVFDNDIEYVLYKPKFEVKDTDKLKQAIECLKKINEMSDCGSYEASIIRMKEIAASFIKTIKSKLPVKEDISEEENIMKMAEFHSNKNPFTKSKQH